MFEVLPRVMHAITSNISNCLMKVFQCVLSGIIVVALKGMYVQAAALPRFYREGKLEAISWVVTFIAVVLVDVDVGYVITVLNRC